MSRAFDAIVVGAGQAGPALADRLTAAGMTVAVIERKLIGGTCVNTGCTPTKALVASAYAAHLARRATDYGLEVDDVRVDMKRVKARVDTIVKNSRTNLESWLASMPGCTLIRGHARFNGPNSVVVDGQELSAERIFINVGGRPRHPDLPGINDVKTLDSSSLLKLDEVPPRLVIIGGSYVGLEFAQIFRRLGSEVTVVEQSPRLVMREDEDISAEIRHILEAEGIKCRVGAECIRLAPRGNDIGVGLKCSEGPEEVIGSHVLLAVGRRPNTDDLGLEKAGVETDERRFIRVDDQLATSVEGIWALGDCNGRGAFTHTAYNDFEIVAANLIDGEDRRVCERVSAYALYIDPPLGRVGMTEAEARNSGRKILTSRRPMSRVARAVEKGEVQGLMKLVADAETKQILGAAILGTGGDEAIHGLVDAINAAVPYPTLQWAVPIHPTVSELIPTVIGNLKAPV
jgi:pyruvate/2-oxoglutarate dehydrogenase complex dihydrolipoamide dehydrogenase (E3) component